MRFRVIFTIVRVCLYAVSGRPQSDSTPKAPPPPPGAIAEAGAWAAAHFAFTDRPGLSNLNGKIGDVPGLSHFCACGGVSTGKTTWLRQSRDVSSSASLRASFGIETVPPYVYDIRTYNIVYQQ